MVQYEVDCIITRINCVPAGELTQQHLVAEYRELPRIFNLVRAAIERGERPTDKRNPRAYTLGTGHVRFFYPRLGWLKERQRELVGEMQARGYKPSFTDVDGLDAGIDRAWLGNWTPDDAAMAINRERIATRLREQKPTRRLAKDRDRLAGDAPVVQVEAVEGLGAFIVGRVFGHAGNPTGRELLVRDRVRVAPTFRCLPLADHLEEADRAQINDHRPDFLHAFA